IGRKTLGNYPCSGTEIIKQLGEEHMKTGYPIVYTSADSVFQIAAHEEVIPIEEQYRICKIAREMLIGEHNVGRVIARPFIGRNSTDFCRTTNRKDFGLPPPEETLLDKIKNSRGEVVGIGKIEDIFAGQGLTKSIHTKNNQEGIQKTIESILNSQTPPESSSGLNSKLIFTNLIDFDMLWGHRRNIQAYYNGLKEFDNALPEIIKAMSDDDVLFITSDHGNDPTYTKHTDHTREYVPLLVYGKKLKQAVNLGIRTTFADLGQTIAEMFGIEKLQNGESFRKEII
ncbi:MAG: phosphopentomutase, partial [Elusimicrobiota bacterium]|nr:phosphopentomutase [Elusimicrobiota bacterium]